MLEIVCVSEWEREREREMSRVLCVSGEEEACGAAREEQRAGRLWRANVGPDAGRERRELRAQVHKRHPRGRVVEEQRAVLEGHSCERTHSSF